jgi:hypothetical protein
VINRASKVHREHRHDEGRDDDRDRPERQHQAAVAPTEIGAEERTDTLPLLKSAHHDISEREKAAQERSREQPQGDRPDQGEEVFDAG